MTDMQLCFHESSHAVVAIDTGNIVELVKVDPAVAMLHSPGNRGCCTVFGLSHASAAVAVATMAAGGIGEAEFVRPAKALRTIQPEQICDNGGSRLVQDKR